jgi:integrase
VAHVRRRNGVWHLIFRDVSLREKSISSPARTKTEAQRFADELERMAWRQAAGLDEGFVPMLFSDLVAKYEEGVVPTHSDPSTTLAQLRKHLLPRLGKKLVHQIKAGDIQSLLASKIGELSDSSREKLRVRLQALFEYAHTHLHCLRGDNPAKLVKKVKVMRTRPRFLPAEYVPRIVAAAQEPELFAVAFYTGMRKGELCGLQRADVDFKRREISVRASYDGPTKGSRERKVKIPEELVPYLCSAFAKAECLESAWLFPSSTGGMRKDSWNAAEAFRRALCAAGLVSGYELTCVIRTPARRESHGRAKLSAADAGSIRSRHAAGEGVATLASEFGVSQRAIRKVAAGHSWASPPARLGCGYVLQVNDKPSGGVLCPQCGRTMRERAVALPFTLKHARSTWGTWAYRATGDIRFVKEQLGHSNIDVTMGHYAESMAAHELDQANKVSYKTLALQLPANTSEPEQKNTNQSELIFDSREPNQSGTKQNS